MIDQSTKNTPPARKEIRVPKLGMEPIRREALVQAIIDEIGASGSLDVPVSRIARRAGMSSALAHHYFGKKDQMFLAAMRHILREYGREVRSALAEATTPRARLTAIIMANFADSCFTQPTVNAWMFFYAQAQSSPEAARLLRLYQRRLHSNLVDALRPLTDAPVRVAEATAATIDGIYLRAAFDGLQLSSAAPQIVLSVVESMLGDQK